jgi:hypothetical protein
VYKLQVVIINVIKKTWNINELQFAIYGPHTHITPLYTVQCISVNNRGNEMKSLYYGDQVRFTGQEREKGQDCGCSPEAKFIVPD